MYSGHMAIRIAASEFKAKCLGLLDRVATTGETIIVTKRGRPVAQLSPVDEPPSLLGSVTFLVDDEELIKPILDPMDAERE